MSTEAAASACGNSKTAVLEDLWAISVFVPARRDILGRVGNAVDESLLASVPMFLVISDGSRNRLPSSPNDSKYWRFISCTRSKWKRNSLVP